MKRIEHRFSYLEYPSRNDLNNDEIELISQASIISKQAYAPYSLFNVGAAIRFDNGNIITGNNQENAAYPSGLCAERVALFYAKSQHPELAIKEIAITASSKKFKVTDPITPCGACRQAILEYEMNQNHPIKIILGSEHTDKVIVIDSVKNLLPFSFDEVKLKND